jgi:hypothetical protein
MMESTLGDLNVKWVKEKVSDLPYPFDKEP